MNWSSGDNTWVTTHANFSVGDPEQLMMGRTLISDNGMVDENAPGGFLWVFIRVYIVGRDAPETCNRFWYMNGIFLLFTIFLQSLFDVSVRSSVFFFISLRWWVGVGFRVVGRI